MGTIIGIPSCAIRLLCHVPVGMVSVVGTRLYHAADELDQGIFDAILHGRSFFRGIEILARAVNTVSVAASENTTLTSSRGLPRLYGTLSSGSALGSGTDMSSRPSVSSTWLWLAHFSLALCSSLDSSRTRIASVEMQPTGETGLMAGAFLRFPLEAPKMQTRLVEDLSESGCWPSSLSPCTSSAGQSTLCLVLERNISCRPSPENRNKLFLHIHLSRSSNRGSPLTLIFTFIYGSSAQLWSFRYMPCLQRGSGFGAS